MRERWLRSMPLVISFHKDKKWGILQMCESQSWNQVRKPMKFLLFMHAIRLFAIYAYSWYDHANACYCHEAQEEERSFLSNTKNRIICPTGEKPGWFFMVQWLVTWMQCLGLVCKDCVCISKLIRSTYNWHVIGKYIITLCKSCKFHRQQL